MVKQLSIFLKVQKKTVHIFYFQNLLLLEEFEEPSSECFDQENIVEIKAANFVWDLPLEESDNNSKNEKENKKKKKSSGTRM